MIENKQPTSSFSEQVQKGTSEEIIIEEVEPQNTSVSSSSSKGSLPIFQPNNQQQNQIEENFSSWLLERALEHSDANLLDLLLSNHSQERNRDTIDKCLYEAFIQIDCMNNKLKQTQYQFLHKMAEQQLEVIATRESTDKSVVPDWKKVDKLIQDFVSGYIDDAKITFRNEVNDGSRPLVDTKAKRLIKGKKDKALLNFYVQKLGHDLNILWEKIRINCQKETASISKKTTQFKRLKELANNKIKATQQQKTRAEETNEEAVRRWNERQDEIITPRTTWSKKIPKLLHGSNSTLMHCYEEYSKTVLTKQNSKKDSSLNENDIQKQFIVKVLEASISLSWQDAEGNSLRRRIAKNQTDKEKCETMLQVLRKWRVPDFDLGKLSPEQQKLCSLLSKEVCDVSNLFDKTPNRTREELAAHLEESLLYGFVLCVQKELLQKIKIYLTEKVKENAKIKSQQKFDYFKIVNDILTAYEKEEKLTDTKENKLLDAVEELLGSNLTSYLEEKKAIYELFSQNEKDTGYRDKICQQVALNLQVFFAEVKKTFNKNKKVLQKAKKFIAKKFIKKHGYEKGLDELLKVNSDILKAVGDEIKNRQDRQIEEEKKLRELFIAWPEKQKKQTEKLVQWFNADPLNYFPNTFIGMDGDAPIVLQIQFYSVLAALDTTRKDFVDVLKAAIGENSALKDELVLEIEEKARSGKLPERLKEVTNASDQVELYQTGNNRELVGKAVAALQQTAKENGEKYLDFLQEEGQEPGRKSIEIYCGEKGIHLYIWQQEQGAQRLRLLKSPITNRFQTGEEIHLLYITEGEVKVLDNFTSIFYRLSNRIQSVINSGFLNHLAAKKDSDNFERMLNMVGTIKKQKMHELIDACDRTPLLLIKLLESHHFSLPQAIDFPSVLCKEKEHVEFIQDMLEEYRKYLLAHLTGRSQLEFYNKIPEWMFFLYRTLAIYKKAIADQNLADIKKIKKTLEKNIREDRWWFSWLKNLFEEGTTSSRLTKTLKNILKNLQEVEKSNGYSRLPLHSVSGTTYSNWSKQQTKVKRTRFKEISKKHLEKNEKNYRMLLSEVNETKHEIVSLRKKITLQNETIEVLNEDKEVQNKRIQDLEQDKEVRDQEVKDLKKDNTALVKRIDKLEKDKKETNEVQNKKIQGLEQDKEVSALDKKKQNEKIEKQDHKIEDLTKLVCTLMQQIKQIELKAEENKLIRSEESEKPFQKKL